MTDPLETLIASALTAAGEVYVREDENPSHLDFRLDSGIEIEVKQFHSPRIADQMSRAPEVIAVQGKRAAAWLAMLIARQGVVATADTAETRRLLAGATEPGLPLSTEAGSVVEQCAWTGAIAIAAPDGSHYAYTTRGYDSASFAALTVHLVNTAKERCDLIEQQAAQIAALTEQLASAREALLNTPETADFVAAVPLEAAHQRERWGSDHDAGKSPFDWFWLIGYLAQKAADAAMRGDTEKALHHTISTAAALGNWHAALSGRSNFMRPGIEPPKALARNDHRGEG